MPSPHGATTARGPLGEAFRAFVDPAIHDQPPATRRRRGRTVEDEAVTVYLLGYLKKGNWSDKSFMAHPQSGYVQYTTLLTRDGVCKSDRVLDCSANKQPESQIVRCNRLASG